MKKLIFTCLLFLFIANISKAQFVEIPDSNFRNALIEKYPTCFNSNGMLDTTCSLIVNETLLFSDSKNINSLDGIQYFKNLKTLYCNRNNLTILTLLPNTIKSLYCGDNQLLNLPTLPDSLVNLQCENNLLSRLENLPNSIIDLDCYNNQITFIDKLPSSLIYFHCYLNQLSNLPELPNSITEFYCNDNKLNSLPKLPTSLTNLNCQNNRLINLPNLPNSIEYLNCFKNQLTFLPNLPNQLFEFDCSFNQLTKLPNLPFTLRYLGCSNNQLRNLPSLPFYMLSLICNDNPLISLPELPEILLNLYCYNCKLASLPKLTNIERFDCSNNQLTSLPELNCYIINCSNNQLTSLPFLPYGLFSLECTNNPLNCLPNIPYELEGLYLKGTNIKCLPTAPFSLDFETDSILPICSNPSDICEIKAYAKGLIYYDSNNNGVFDNFTETIISNQIINVSPNGWKGISDVNGDYWVNLDTAINNTWSCNIKNKYSTIVPNSYSETPSDLGQLPNNYNFGIQFKPNVKDLDATLAGTAVRPGFTTNIGVTANNIGTINQSNVTIKLKKPAGFNVLSTSTPPTSTLNDTLFWENVSVDFLKSQSFYVELQVPVDAVLGSEIVYEAWANGTQGDTTPIDNYTKWTETVRGSFDPNDKLVSKTTLPPAYDVEKDRLIYTIRFQNTGTDTAFYVRVKDEMPTNLNLSTLRVINASHAYQLIVREKNIVEFAFPNINLPDRTTNEPKSHGFVQFSIELKAGLPVNTKIENNASIYFDYNAPIITNFATTEVKLTTGLVSNKNLDFKLYPNPTNSSVRIELPYSGDGNWILSDISGRQIKAENIANNEKLMELNLNDLPSGTYFITIQLGGNVSTAKIIKM